jgi:hypothetical protein
MMITVVVGMVLFVAVCSLAVDYGRVVLVKTELQGAADAAARAGAGAMSADPVAQAIAVARLNIADGLPVELLSGGALPDVELGRWDNDSSIFTPSATDFDAVRVTARRIEARGNGVRLPFADIVGRPTQDVVAVAIATSAPTSFGVIGLDFITMQGNSSMGYWSSTGKRVQNYGTIASNGNINLNGNTYIYGDARHGIGMSVNSPSRVKGTVRALRSPLEFANGDGSSAQSSNNNGTIPSFANGMDLSLNGNQWISLSAGVYYFRNVSIAPNAGINCTGPVTIYSWGSFDLRGQINTASNSPRNLKIVMCPGPSNQVPGTMNVGSSGNLFMSVYAPQSPVTLSGSGDIYGAVLGKSINMTGTSAIYYDLGLEGESEIRLVR